MAARSLWGGGGGGEVTELVRVGQQQRKKNELFGNAFIAFSPSTTSSSSLAYHPLYRERAHFSNEREQSWKETFFFFSGSRRMRFFPHNINNERRTNNCLLNYLLSLLLQLYYQKVCFFFLSYSLSLSLANFFSFYNYHILCLENYSFFFFDPLLLLLCFSVKPITRTKTHMY